MSKMDNKVSYLRLLLTSRCNLSCPYCHHEGNYNSTTDMKLSDVKCILEACYKLGVRKFKLMGGEPTLFADLQAFVSFLSNLGNDVDVSIVSNGLFDYSTLRDYFDRGLDRVNISVHAWEVDNALNVGMSESQFRIMKLNIEQLIIDGKLGKLNYVYRNNLDDGELFDCVSWVDEHGAVLDVLNVLGNSSNSYASMESIEQHIRRNVNIRNEYIRRNNYSLPSKRLVLRNGGEINLKLFPLNKELPFRSCNDCKRYDMCTEGIKAIRLLADGRIKPCLFRNDNVFSVTEEKNCYKELKNFLETL